MEHRDSEPQSFLLFRLLLKIQQIICDIVSSVFNILNISEIEKSQFSNS